MNPISWADLLSKDQSLINLYIEQLEKFAQILDKTIKDFGKKSTNFNTAAKKIAEALDTIAKKAEKSEGNLDSHVKEMHKLTTALELAKNEAKKYKEQIADLEKVQKVASNTSKSATNVQNANTKATEAAIGSVDLLKSQLKELTAQYDSLSASERENNKALAKNIEQTSIALKEAQLAKKEAIKSNTEEATSLDKLKTELRLTQSEYNKLSEAERTNGQVAGELLDKIAGLNKEIKAGEAPLKAAKKETDLVEGSYEALSKQTAILTKRLKQMPDAFNPANKEAQALRFQIANNQKVLKEFDGSIGNFQRNVGNYEKALGGMKNGLATVGAAAGAVGVAVMALSGVFTAIFSGVQKSLDAFKDFEFQMTRVKSISGATSVEVEQLKQNAMLLGSTSSKTATEVGQLQEELAKLGFSVPEILEVSDSVLALAEAHRIDLADAAGTAGGMVKAFGLDISETKRAMDVLTESTNISGNDFKAFSENFSKFAPIANQVGISVEAATASFSLLRDMKVESSTAATALKNVFTDLSNENSKLSKFVGFTVKSKEDLIRALGVLDKANLSAAKSQELVGKEFAAVLPMLANNVDKIEEYTTKLEASSGATDKMATDMRGTMQGSMDAVSSGLEGVFIRIGEKLAPAFGELTQKIIVFFEKFSEGLDKGDYDGLISIISDAIDLMSWAFDNLAQPAMDFLKWLSEANEEAKTSGESLNIFTHALKQASPAVNIFADSVTFLAKALGIADLEAVAKTRALDNLAKKADESAKKYSALAHEVETFAEKFNNVGAQREVNTVLQEHIYKLKQQAEERGEIFVLTKEHKKELDKIKQSLIDAGREEGTFGEKAKETKVEIEAQATAKNKVTNAQKEAIKMAEREVKAQKELSNAKLQAQIDSEKFVANSGVLDNDQQIEQLRKIADLEVALNQKKLDDILAAENLTASEIELRKLNVAQSAEQIEISLQQKITAIHEEGAKERAEIANKEAEASQNLADFRLGVAIKNEQDITERHRLQVEQIKSQLDKELENTELLESERVLLREQANDKIADLNKQYDNAEEERQKKLEEEKLERQMRNIDFVADGLTQLSGIFKGNFEAETKALQAEKEKQLEIEGLSEQQKEQINEKFAKKEQELRLRQAKSEKRQRLFEVAINTAAAVTKSILASPLTFGLPFSGFALAQGAIQAAVIASQPLPSFRKGTEFLNEGSKGSDSDGYVIQAHKGERIIPKHINEKLGNVSNENLPNLLLPSQAQGVGNTTTTERIERDTVNINFDKNGIEKFLENKNGRAHIQTGKFKW